ncbi:DUF6262 family protein [Azospirillum sp. HJ39]|uniref:DUF6262 family protein n=1 Tax=Azospirillum sp. HJ39 TaxID=3159496 RepID=UPI0035569603
MLKGEDNVRRLQSYLRALEEEGRGLPARDGRPNLSVIASACGFDRGVFYANQAAKLILDEATTALGLEADTHRPQTAFAEARIQQETKARSDVRTKSLEEEVMRLRAENAQLRSENERLRAVRRLMAETGRMP